MHLWTLSLASIIFSSLGTACLLLLVLATNNVHALAQAHQPSLNKSSSSSPSSPSTDDAPQQQQQQQCSSALLDVPKLKRAIQSGRVYQHLDFLSPDQVDVLWEEIRHLEDNGAFARSGLSNTVQGSNQQFGNKDRTLCPVPWWTKSLLDSNNSNNNKDNVSQETISSSTAPLSAEAIKEIQTISSKIQDLRLFLSSTLNRPTMTDATLAHECYYSMSTIGSYLPRHMDERHEELKGAKGWLLPSRRSLSWLIYLSEPPNWTLPEHGGALRTFPPRSVKSQQQLTHDQGNLQIGWLLQDDGDNNSSKHTSTAASKSSNGHQPVYLDSWFPIASQPGQPPEPHCVLYIRNEQQDQVLLTKPWLTELLQGISVPDFLKSWAEQQSVASKGDDDNDENNQQQEGLFLQQQYARQFSLLEDRPAWDSGQIPQGTVHEDVAPLRGSLVVFDSVTLPHQVEIIKQGRRVALAGWFHEETQPFPANLYS